MGLMPFFMRNLCNWRVKTNTARAFPYIKCKWVGQVVNIGCPAVLQKPPVDRPGESADEETDCSPCALHSEA